MVQPTMQVSGVNKFQALRLTLQSSITHGILRTLKYHSPYETYAPSKCHTQLANMSCEGKNRPHS